MPLSLLGVSHVKCERGLLAHSCVQPAAQLEAWLPPLRHRSERWSCQLLPCFTSVENAAVLLSLPVTSVFPAPSPIDCFPGRKPKGLTGP